MAYYKEVGAAFVCGVLVTVGMLSLTSPATPEVTYLYAPATVQPTAALTVPAAEAYPTPAMMTQEEYAMPTYDDDMVDSEMVELEEMPSPPMTPGSTLGAISLAVAAAGVAIGYFWRRAVHSSGVPQLENLVTLPDNAMAAIMGTKRRLSRERQDMLESSWDEKRKWMAAPLSKELREKYNVRSMVVRKGDEVRVQAGSFKGTTGKVVESDVANLLVYVEGIERKKNNGKTVPVGIPASKLEITNLLLEDKTRVEILERRAKGRAEAAERRALVQAGNLLPSA